ncbi:hypothetical protein [Chondromyces apiculatus]|uniref:Uncharacterized protein n=1 Tax=Chondromyces apiculatus DSM 436 TaxID=1192034 RepID=A0A017T8Y1_9BACT|nr:hypothetical protein [Chondromyces apiculatus]EYF05031.1 Hypothetical protein CAP_3621 [Chondromyces apiculatus DSM 436]
MIGTPPTFGTPLPGEPPAPFTDRLVVTLDLDFGTDAFSLPAGSIERLGLDATVHGFSAEVVFFVSAAQETDGLLSRFTSQGLITATLTLANGNEGYADPQATPWKLKGPVTERRLAEIVSDDRAGLPVVGRRYTLRFLDPARALWGQHRPLELHAGASMKEVLEQHVAPGMQLDLSWPRLGVAQDILCVGLGGACEASFHDFVVWFLHDTHGVLELDAAEGKYRLGGAKARAGEGMTLDAGVIGEIRLLAPEPPRPAVAVLNGAAEAAVHTKEVTNAHAVAGVRREVLVRTPIQTEVDPRVTVETARLAAPEHGLEISLRRCPPAFVVPGGMVTLAAELGDRIYPARKKYRVIAAALDGRAAAEAPDLTEGSARYTLTLRLRLERESDPTPRLPPFRRPSYPVLVEGKILSASGGDEDRTWDAREGKDDARPRYRIQIPLWNQTVVAPFIPGQAPGHFFFPAYKNERVLVALGFDSAEIVAFLDWAGKLPEDTQGDQIVLGKRDRDETTVRHVYEDSKPALRVERRLGRDVETLVISEGTIRFEVKEEKGEDAPEPTYDLKPTVDAAKDQASAEVRSSVGALSGKFEGAMGGATGSLDAATAEVEGAADAAVATVGAKVEAAQAELQGMMSSATEALQAVVAKVGEARAAVLAALFT